MLLCWCIPPLIFSRRDSALDSLFATWYVSHILKVNVDRLTFPRSLHGFEEAALRCEHPGPSTTVSVVTLVDLKYLLILFAIRRTQLDVALLQAVATLFITHGRRWR